MLGIRIARVELVARPAERLTDAEVRDMMREYRAMREGCSALQAAVLPPLYEGWTEACGAARELELLFARRWTPAILPAPDPTKTTIEVNGVDHDVEPFDGNPPAAVVSPYGWMGVRPSHRVVRARSRRVVGIACPLCGTPVVLRRPRDNHELPMNGFCRRCCGVLIWTAPLDMARSIRDGISVIPPPPAAAGDEGRPEGSSGDALGVKGRRRWDGP